MNRSDDPYTMARLREREVVRMRVRDVLDHFASFLASVTRGDFWGAAYHHFRSRERREWKAWRFADRAIRKADRAASMARDPGVIRTKERA